MYKEKLNNFNLNRIAEFFKIMLDAKKKYKYYCRSCKLKYSRGRSRGAIVLVKLPVPGRSTIWMIIGQGPIALAVGAGEGFLDIFILLCPFSPLSPSLWDTVRYRLKYCLKGPLNQKSLTTLKYSYEQVGA